MTRKLDELFEKCIVSLKTGKVSSLENVEFRRWGISGATLDDKSGYVIVFIPYSNIDVVIKKEKEEQKLIVK